MENSTGKESSLIFKETYSFNSEHLFSDKQKQALQTVKEVNDLHEFQKVTTFKGRSKGNVNTIIGIDINYDSINLPMRAVCQIAIDGRVSNLTISTSEPVTESIDILLQEIKITLLNHIKNLEKCRQENPNQNGR